MATRLNKRLVLIHTCEPWVNLPISKPFQGEGSPLWDVTQAIEANAVDLAAGRLREIADLTTKMGAKTEPVVLTGNPTKCMLAAIDGFKAGMILVGASDGSQRLLPFGLSNALSLLADSPVPVMIVAEGMNVDLDLPKLRLLLCDDLEEQSEGAVDFAFELAGSLGKSDLRQVYINGLTLEGLTAAVTTAAATSHSSLSVGLSATELHTSLLKKLEDRIAERALGREEYIEAAGGSYEAEVLTGDIATQLERAVEKIQPNIIIFGRHERGHRKPFMIGRVPFQQMMAEKRPVIVVPVD
jgi:nucleotide-binding universal stress UspA family protein